MAQHVACLTFDFDVWSGMTARGLTTPTPVSRGEFGLVGARRILALLEQSGIRSTWFVPGVVIDSHEANVAEVVEAGHAIGHHGYSHRVPATLPPELEEAEMVRAIESIVRVSGRRPRGYRSPAWDLSPVTIDLLLKHGFDYDSSLMGDDHTPYFARRGDKPGVDEPFVFGETTRLVEMPISWSLDDHPHFEFMRLASTVTPGLANAGMVLENWLADFAYMRRTTDWGILTYTCHPYVIGRGHRMLMLEKLIEGLRAMDAAFMTLDAAADCFLARRA
ncbi:polysaccharide deacetylase family protein [Marinivivus vitaminiproducens]|uniref:polysaccharide deacetylase family protein n=1 Tax=Marinivivus vitaminiproducens TaxID=3035935 RepID=UPI00279E2A39|nr:polysaccharide deacetylase [Geminicoccaceae bacterium SCSIO 64248]